MKRSRRIFASAVLYANAFIATTVLHELAHAIAAIACGRSAVLYNNRVEHPREVDAAVSTAAHVIGSAAGPFFSLLQGILVLLWLRARRPRSGTVQLFLIWFSFHGFMNFAGYLFSTPFAPTADMGNIARHLGLPVMATIAMSIAGFYALRSAAFLLAPHFLGLLPSDADEKRPEERKRFLVDTAVLAWLTGIALVLPSAFPIPHWLSIFYVVIAGASTTFTTEYSRKLTTAPTRTVAAPDVSVPAMIVLAGLLALCAIVLTRGIALS